MPTVTKSKKAASAKPNDTVYKIFTDKILAALEGGFIPWHQPWVGGALSYESGKSYRGINAVYLPMIADQQKWKSCFWITKFQAEKQGGHIKEGEYYTPLAFWKRDVITRKSKVVDEPDDQYTRMKLLFWQVYNLDQTEGLPPKERPDMTDIPPQEFIDLLDNQPNHCRVTHGIAEKPAYWPTLDRITMPPVAKFRSVADYCSTRAHEEVHATGSFKRLKRVGVQNMDAFGTQQYAQEELVAEIGAGMLRSLYNLDMNLDTERNTVAYIQNWLTVLKKDRKMVVLAAAQAQRAVDYIRGITYEGVE